MSREVLHKITQSEKDIVNRNITINRMIAAKKHFTINESRCVANVDYDQEQNILTIEFVERGTYIYREVPLDVFVDFASAGSQGRYFNLYIRPTYQTERVA